MRERQRQRTSRGGAEREGDTESEAGSRLRAVSAEPDAGLEPADCKIMTWAEVGCLTGWATHAPQPWSPWNWGMFGCVYNPLVAHVTQFHREDIIYLEKLPPASWKPGEVTSHDSHPGISRMVQHVSTGLSPLFLYNLIEDTECVDNHPYPQPNTAPRNTTGT